ncbi:hypothetical protein LTR54_006909 [Friedmanniomyces endolithicus]|nr:hypothetical protein LTR54_006909 [Friedmanniomyces endolithicus]
MFQAASTGRLGFHRQQPVRTLSHPSKEYALECALTTSLLTVHVVTSDTDGIKKTLNAYRDNLVASNVEGCVNLYASDGVLMAPGYETQVGPDAVKQWYTNIRKLVTLDVEFDIHEAVAITEEYGFARTSSAGMLKINATGVTRKEANQELFVMKKVEGEWKIARYCFSESKLPE